MSTEKGAASPPAQQQAGVNYGFQGSQQQVSPDTMPAPPTYDQANAGVFTTQPQPVHVQTGTPMAYPPAPSATVVQGAGVTVANTPGVTVVTTGAPVMQMGFKFGEESANVTCPACNSLVETRVDTRAGIGAWVTAGAACLLGCWCGCCCAPFGIKSFKVFTHSCPNCKAVLGKHVGAYACDS